jgi:hypothetical protein
MKGRIEPLVATMRQQVFASLKANLRRVMTRFDGYCKRNARIHSTCVVQSLHCTVLC